MIVNEYCPYHSRTGKYMPQDPEMARARRAVRFMFIVDSDLSVEGGKATLTARIYVVKLSREHAIWTYHKDAWRDASALPASQEELPISANRPNARTVFPDKPQTLSIQSPQVIQYPSWLAES